MSAPVDFLGDQPTPGRRGRMLRAPVIMQAAGALIDALDTQHRAAVARVERLEIDREKEAEGRENALCGGAIWKHQERMREMAASRGALLEGRALLDGRPLRWSSAPQIDAAERGERDRFANYMAVLRAKTSYSEQCAAGRATYEKHVEEAREAVAECADRLAAGKLMVARLAAIFSRGAIGNWPVSSITPAELEASAAGLADGQQAGAFLQILTDVKIAELCQTRAELIEKSGFACGLEWNPPGRKDGQGGGGGDDGGAEPQK